MVRLKYCKASVVMATLSILLVIGCGEDWVQQPQATLDVKSHRNTSPASVYPQTPSIHVAYDHHDPLVPSDIETDVFNNYAYARYAAVLLGNPDVADSRDARAIAMAIASSADQSEHSPTDRAAICGHKGQRRQLGGVWTRDGMEPEVSQLTDRFSGNSKCKPTAGHALRCASILDFHTACCQSLAWFNLVRAATDISLNRSEGSYLSLTQQLVSKRRWASISHAGTKAWLSYCAPAIDQGPGTIADLKATTGRLPPR